MAAPRCINILTFSLLSNFCLIQKRSPAAHGAPPGNLESCKPSEIPVKKCSLCQKVHIVFRRVSLTLFLVFSSLKLKDQRPGFQEKFFWSIRACLGHSWVLQDAASYRQWPLPDILVLQVQPFSSLQAFLCLIPRKINERH